MKTAIVNQDGKLISKLTQKYMNIIESGKITENELISMRSYMSKDREAANLINEAWYEKEETEISLEESQVLKGIAWLKGQTWSKTGKERKNSPFGYREKAVLNEVSDIKLHSLYNAGNMHHDFYLPVYIVYGAKGGSFEYYVNGGKVHVTN